MTSSTEWETPSELADQLLDLYGLTCPPRWGLPRRLEYKTYGPRVGRILELLGYPPMPWQQYELDVALEVDPATGNLAYREVLDSVMRQQGKTIKNLGVKLHRLAAWRRQNVLYTAQTRNYARQRVLDEFVPTMDESRLKRRYTVRRRLGEEGVIWVATRSILGIAAPTEKAAHGPPLDLAVIDEAFAHQDDRLDQAVDPSQLTRGNAQKWVSSAAGDDKSHYWNKKRNRGREIVERFWLTGEFPTTAYFDWSPLDDAPRDDPATWWSCMPALGYTITEDIVRHERETLEDDAEFDRAMLNRTNKKLPPPDPNIPVREWMQLEDDESRRAGDVALAVDVTPSRSHTSIGVFGLRPDGDGHTELIAYGRGTDWVAQRLAELREKLNPIAIGLDARSPAAALQDELKEFGIELPEDPAEPKRGDLIVTNSTQFGQAFGQIIDAIRKGTVRHIGQAELNSAIAGTRTRPMGDAMAPARKTASVDISPFVSIMVARWAFRQRFDQVTDEYDPLANIF